LRHRKSGEKERKELMFKKLGISAAVLAGLSLLTPAAAVAEEHHEHGGNGHGGYRYGGHRYGGGWYGDRWYGGPRYRGGIYYGPYVGPYYGPIAEGYYDQWGVWHPYFGISFGW
jgi:hypothetical protein